MNVFSAIQDIRNSRRTSPGVQCGLVPTMGFLHEGHLSLIRRAREENDTLGVSIFVNPIQFNNQQDLAAYPINIDRDLALLEKEGVDLVWAPPPEVMYPEGFQTYIDVEKIAVPLEGAARPGHFRGVATVVAKLFNVFQPDNAYFGQKDAQQVAVIRRMAKDLNFDVNIITCPTIREPDGLAMSSRNANLTAADREQASCLYHGLNAARALAENGERNAAVLRDAIRDIIEPVKNARIDYISIADPDTLVELDAINRSMLISLAVFMSDVRLIDNMLLEF